MTESPASSGIDELRIILEDRVNQDDNQDQNSTLGPKFCEKSGLGD